MPDLSDFPIQGKLRIRQDNYERDAEYIRAHVGYVSEAELKSVPGYAFLKFYYADFAATQAQWAALAPEMDKRNILVTLYEGPVLYMEALAEEEKVSKIAPLRDRRTWIYNGAAILLLLLGAGLLAVNVIDQTICLLIGLIALGVLVVGFLRRRSRKLGVDSRKTE